MMYEMSTTIMNSVHGAIKLVSQLSFITLIFITLSSINFYKNNWRWQKLRDILYFNFSYTFSQYYLFYIVYLVDDVGSQGTWWVYWQYKGK